MSSIDIVVPNLPESVADATVAVWHKKSGDTVKQDDILLEIETDKIMLEIPAPNTGILESISEQEGSTVVSGQILGRLNIDHIVSQKDTKKIFQDQKSITSVASQEHILTRDNKNHNILTPSIRKLMTEHNLQLTNIQGSGIKGRLTRQDIESHIHSEKKLHYTNQQNNENVAHHHIQNTKNDRKETRIVMNRLRKKISERLLAVTKTTAMLTTFNEVNMQPIIKLRKKYGELFEKRYGITLGIMSFYVKAVLEGLRHFPEINASIDGEEIVYYHYFDISIAVSTVRGLITPVLRDIDTLSMSDIEKNIKSLAEKGRDGKLTIEELSGGNFTITNGGVFGSLMSTPIINPPQSAILGMHAIKDRPIAQDGQIVILPMMYLALSYDHRLIDGKDSVRFLVYIKELLEDPTRLFLEI
ncbi:dihydrolipoamide succinyltransferase E2 component [Candidatus Blochmanniella pennsylvanica str. BPEN]|uniref:Dihydrolipoyllysine-residue succinyltransferase component of 2-oxoglutarate dehydrogenase complex n=1 Tax=Blochmanniella pennsylvanica (strain BPEN) TaxID=291272 RepID=Q492X5_BLOPB|nr:2-oxoglutarate dehydrogenase complex dihydrolipoyllysine-residue succinyltransferase [Candidatus Blochmannia pennsylvanicus]AAZ40967.1 dihydrolipoamide succinyltransferase E2 component [Candidatus Blochmannia pennsylvanicus str. BPEN]UOY04190.1 2-oxoglutarate dehydrogenase complex dihydrolipoyllysine-residue succinyltransferase [Candidatus Blochmannia pennsylvanicus]